MSHYKCRRHQSPRLKKNAHEKDSHAKVATTEHKKDWPSPTMMLSSSRIVAAAVGRSQTQTSRLYSLRATKAATSMPLSSSRVASAALGRSRVLARRWLSESKTGATETVAKETVAKETIAKEAVKEDTGYWHSAKFWGALGAIAGWGMYVLLFVCLPLQPLQCCSATLQGKISRSNR
jgi:hypothetical protein